MNNYLFRIEPDLLKIKIKFDICHMCNAMLGCECESMYVIIVCVCVY